MMTFVKKALAYAMVPLSAEVGQESESPVMLCQLCLTLLSRLLVYEGDQHQVVLLLHCLCVFFLSMLFFCAAAEPFLHLRACVSVTHLCMSDG